MRRARWSQQIYNKEEVLRRVLKTIEISHKDQKVAHLKESVGVELDDKSNSLDERKVELVDSRGNFYLVRGNAAGNFESNPPEYEFRKLKTIIQSKIQEKTQTQVELQKINDVCLLSPSFTPSNRRNTT